MTPDKVGYRIDTLLSGIDNKAITRGIKDADIKLQYTRYMDSLQNNKNHGAIKVITPAHIAGPATVDALKAFVEREKIQILLVDQYSLLEDSNKAKAMHEKVANISKDIKNLQVMYKIPVISVSQMNRTKLENGQQDTTQIGLSDRIGQDATSILMLSREGEFGDLLKINIVKSRDGGDNKKLTYKANFNTGEFYYIEEDEEKNTARNEEINNSYGVF